MFSYLSKFQYSFLSSQLFFIDPSIELFPNFEISTSEEFIPAPAPAPVPTPVVIVLDAETVPSPLLHCSTRVRETRHHLKDYHCFSALLPYMNLTPIVRLVLTLYGSNQWQKNFKP